MTSQPMNIKTLNATAENFWRELDQLLAWDSVSDDKVFSVVSDVIKNVRQRGDAAVVEYTNRFDRMQVQTMQQLELPKTRLQQALQRIPAEQREALNQAADRIRNYAQRQTLESWSYREADGTLLGQQVSAMDRVGLYVPGGKAA
ncbi:MAG TPA: histidinol dehydrogenase, partial [Gammaproteobacteria bacterium]|nr:histidinol dehydrogenase [Gammaproteobacteria bacterium]